MVIFFFFPHKSMTDIQVQYNGNTARFILQYADTLNIESNVCFPIKSLTGILHSCLGEYLEKWMDSPPLGQQEILILATFS